MKLLEMINELFCNTCKEKINLYSDTYIVLTYDEYVKKYQCLVCWEDRTFDI